MTQIAASPGARNVLSLAWPMTFKAVFLHGTVVIDGALVAPLGEATLAAMGLAAALAGFVIGAIGAVSGAMQIRSAQAFGTADQSFLRGVLASGMVLSLGIGVAGVLLLFALAPFAITGWASDATMAADAWRYLQIFALVILFEAVGQCLASYFNGCGAVRLPLFALCLSVPVNVLASLALIHGAFGLPAFGLAGAAMGSAIAIGLQTTFLVAVLFRRTPDLAKAAVWATALTRSNFTRHVHFCLPIAATFYSAAAATQTSALIYAQMSLNAFAAMTLIAPWIMVAGQVSMQWAQATGIIVAQLLGRGTPPDELDRFLSSAWRGAFVTAALVAAVFTALCLGVNRIYPDLAPETRAMITGFLPIILVLPFPKASNAICGNTLRASGDTVYVMRLFLWSQWLVRVPAIALAVLVLDWPAFWVLAILLLEEFVKLPGFHGRLASGAWKSARVTA